MPAFIEYTKNYDYSEKEINRPDLRWCTVVIYLSKNISTVKKGEPKKVQVAERPKDVISLWGQEEKLYHLGSVNKTPAYKATNLNNYISRKLNKDTVSLANAQPV